MNKIVVISAYPKGKTSLGESLLADALAGQDAEVINLYDAKIPFYANENTLDEEAKAIFDKLDTSKNWLFLFPIWWSNMPAILKNFFDWGIHYGLIYDGKSVPKAALEGQHKKVIIVCSSGDIYDDDQMQIINLVKENILQYWGVETIESLFIEDTYHFNDEKYEKYRLKLQHLLKIFDN